MGEPTHSNKRTWDEHDLAWLEIRSDSIVERIVLILKKTSHCFYALYISLRLSCLVTSCN